MKGSAFLNYVVLIFVSVALLLAIVSLIKERRLRLALQAILKRLIDRWRSHANRHPSNSTDRHRTDLRTTDRPKGYTLYEFESSRLTNRHTHKVIDTPGLIWGYNKTCSFGLMKFDTTAKDPQVTLECIGIDGKVIESYTLKVSKLR